MNYLEWSRVIDELITQIGIMEKTAEINRCFLKTANKERAKYPAPEKPKDSEVQE